MVTFKLEENNYNIYNLFDIALHSVPTSLSLNYSFQTYIQKHTEHSPKGAKN